MTDQITILYQLKNIDQPPQRFMISAADGLCLTKEMCLLTIAFTTHQHVMQCLFVHTSMKVTRRLYTSFISSATYLRRGLYC